MHQGEVLSQFVVLFKNFERSLVVCSFLRLIFHIDLNINYSNFHFVDFLVRSTTLKVGALEVKRRISVKKAPLSLCPK